MFSGAGPGGASGRGETQLTVRPSRSRARPTRARRQRGHMVVNGGRPPVTPAAPSVIPGAEVEVLDR